MIIVYRTRLIERRRGKYEVNGAISRMSLKLQVAGNTENNTQEKPTESRWPPKM
jgi:hypothetical protein